MAATSLSAADGFVIAMLVVMALSLGVVALLFLIMSRNEARRDRQVEELLQELADEEKREKEKEKHAPAPSEAADREPWEKDGDWWKN